MSQQSAIFRGRKASKLEIVDVLEVDRDDLPGVADSVLALVEEPVPKREVKKATPVHSQVPSVSVPPTPEVSGESISPMMRRRG